VTIDGHIVVKQDKELEWREPCGYSEASRGGSVSRNWVLHGVITPSLKKQIDVFFRWT
jgi:hypothetical protein